MREPTTPKNGYGFKNKITGETSLMLFIGTGDSIDNYDEISEEEYNSILLSKEEIPV